MEERPSFSHRTVFAGLAASFVLALGVAAFIYVRYVRFEPVAATHLPAQSARIVQLGVEQAVVYEPFRRHLLRLADGDSSRLARLKRATTVELAIDAREFVWVDTPEGGWVVVLAGLFRRDGALDGIQRIFAEEDVVLHKEGDAGRGQRLVHHSGVSFTIADDGTWLLASSPELLAEARSPEAPPSDLPAEMALGVLAAAPPPGFRGPRFERARLSILPGREFPTSVRVTLEEPALRVSLAELLETELGNWLLVGPAPSLETADAPGDPVRSASGELEPGEFDEAVGRLARHIEKALGASR